MRKTMRWILGVIAIGLVAGIVPNAVWLVSSTARVQNAGTAAVGVRLVIVDAPGQVVDLGTMAPGSSRFLRLSPRGEATLAVETGVAGGWRRHCAEYIEGSMYRVGVLIRSAEDVACRTDLPLLDRLLLIDLLP